ncbi:DUF4274 domain-containing protein [Stenotrophomonas sp. HMWF003]|uniref:DUF4274 domain-containing protein n=1 Tax=Stenotrophomonas sp. HMWF003 TaxID=2056840 RepID=UPI0015E85BDF|nr:DUF4274 domain-containing protein [Stenotrophomonas sp. HMWF003]
MNEQDYEAAKWALLHAHLVQATPEQRHLYVARSNYGDNQRALAWLADQPDLDRATALMLFWSVGAGSHAQYESLDDVPDYDRDTHQFIGLVQQRFLGGFYADHGIGFDPTRWDGAGPNEHSADELQRMPAQMLQAVDGEHHIDPFDEAYDEDYDDGLPMALVEQLYELADVHIAWEEANPQA